MEKIIKNNWWNRLWRHKSVKRLQTLTAKLEEVVTFLKRIGDVTYKDGYFDSVSVTGTDSLLDLVDIHKQMWNAGYRNDNIGPCSHGMFRTESIPEMKPDEVWIGDIYGLNTLNIPSWEQHKNDGKTGGGYDIYNYLTDYQIILQRYKIQLSSNLKAIFGEQDPEQKLKQLVERGY